MRRHARAHIGTRSTHTCARLSWSSQQRPSLVPVGWSLTYWTHSTSSRGAIFASAAPVPRAPLIYPVGPQPHTLAPLSRASSGAAGLRSARMEHQTQGVGRGACVHASASPGIARGPTTAPGDALSDRWGARLCITHGRPHTHGPHLSTAPAHACMHVPCCNPLICDRWGARVVHGAKLPSSSYPFMGV